MFAGVMQHYNRQHNKKKTSLSSNNNLLYSDSTECFKILLYNAFMPFFFNAAKIWTNTGQAGYCQSAINDKFREVYF